MSARETIEREAAQWLASRDNASGETSVDPAFDAWLATSPEHKLAYWRLENAWRNADRLGSARATSVRRSLERRWIQPASIAAGFVLAACIAGGAWHLVRQTPQQNLATEVGGRRMTTLADGSAIELNADTRVRVRLDGQDREVWLDQGEAYFEVAHDPSRPFIVHAGSRQVTVLGTRFLVKRMGDRVTVAVRDGKVRVQGDRIPARAVMLTPGHIAVADGGSTLIAAQSVEKVEEALSWRTGFITFDNTTLAEAAAEFNRYNLRKMVVAPEVADIRISGVFEARNVAAFSRLMRDGLDLKVADADGQVMIAAEK